MAAAVSNDSSPSPYASYDDPLFLSNSDQPNLQLISQQFDGNNFVNWKREVYHALIAKNKEGFVDGSCKKPSTTDKTYHQWIRCDLMVLKWILNSVVRNIRESLQYASTSKELWNEIIDRNGQTNSLEIYQLKKEIGAFSQENSSLVDYYSGLKRAWETVDSLDPIPLCTCGVLDSCTCNLLKRIVDREANSKLIQFLMGLNSSYEAMKTHVLTMDPLPPLNKVFALLQKVERQKLIHDSAEGLIDGTAFHSSGFPDSSSSGFKKPKYSESEVKLCTYCHHLGHSKDECFKLKECGHCGRKGHAQENCFRLKNASGGGRNFKGTSKSSFKPKGSTGGYRRSVHNTEVLLTNPDDEIFCAGVEQSDPLSDDFNTDRATPAITLDSQKMDGLVQSVVQQVMKVFSDKHAPLSSINFAGPFK